MGLRLPTGRSGRVFAIGAFAFFAVKGIAWLVLATLAVGGVAKVATI